MKKKCVLHETYKHDKVDVFYVYSMYFFFYSFNCMYVHMDMQQVMSTLRLGK